MYVFLGYVLSENNLPLERYYNCPQKDFRRSILLGVHVIEQVENMS
jgi:hypothetical protein